MNNDFQFDTLAIRSGHQRTNEMAHGEAIFPTSSFVFNNAADAAAKFAGDEPGNIYARMTNPTVSYFQDRLAALEGGEACVATSSGMSAILAIVLALLKSGDHIICSHSVFGTTTVLFTNYIQKFGIAIDFVDLTLGFWKLLYLVIDVQPSEHHLRSDIRVLGVMVLSVAVDRLSDGVVSQLLAYLNKTQFTLTQDVIHSFDVTR